MAPCQGFLSTAWCCVQHPLARAFLSGSVAWCVRSHVYERHWTNQSKAIPSRLLAASEENQGLHKPLQTSPVPTAVRLPAPRIDGALSGASDCCIQEASSS